MAPALIEHVIEEALAPLTPAKPGIATVTHIARITNTDVYLTPGTWARLRQQPALIAKLRAALERTPGVRAMYTRDALEANHFDDDPLGRSLSHSHDADRSGDLTFVLKPYWMQQVSGTTHGSVYEYDTHVPLILMGAGITAGEYRQAASPADIAPTLAFLAGITPPNAQGRVLVEALAK